MQLKNNPLEIPGELTNVHPRPSGDSMPQFNRNYGLWIFFAGTNQCHSDFNSRQNRYFEFYALSHMFDGKGFLTIKNGVSQEINPGDCVIIQPGTIHCYGNLPDENYCEDTVNFFGPAADMLMRSGILVNGLYHIGTLRRLLPIIEYAKNPSTESQLRANIELQHLLVNMYLERQASNPQYPLFDRLLNEVKSHLSYRWTVEEMAECCNLSVDQFRRVFQRFTGKTPKQYVDHLKLRRAEELLLTTDMKIPDIAHTLGYPDVFHFSRRFKEHIGVPPGARRKNK